MPERHSNCLIRVQLLHPLNPLGIMYETLASDTSKSLCPRQMKKIVNTMRVKDSEAQVLEHRRQGRGNKAVAGSRRG
jgi:hypothetical protein